ncbi:MAG: glycoside hydrolase family 18 protein [Aggregatilineales bacterium]
MSRRITPGVLCVALLTAVSVLTNAPAVTQAQSGGPSPTAAATGPAVPQKQIVAYFASWDAYGRRYTPSNMPVDKLTVVNYAFANIVDGKCVIGDSAVDTQKIESGDTTAGPGTLHGNFEQLKQIRQTHPKLGVSISIGGWTWSSQFSKVAMTDDSRKTFVASCIDLFIKGQIPGVDPANAKGIFDGIDIDWEYPVCCGKSENGSDAYSALDTQNYTLLLKEFRRQLDAQGAADSTHYRLTTAMPAGPNNYKHIRLKAASQYVDWFNLMAYDFHGPWDKVTNFIAPLYAVPSDPSSDTSESQFNIDAAVHAYLAAGIPSTKIVLGVPFYGYGWTGVTDSNHGLFQAAGGIPTGTWDDNSSGQTGAFDYRDIANRFVPKYTRYWSDSAQVPWLYDAADGMFITYEDPQSMGIKADYVNANNLGGMMMWEIYDDNGDLLNTIVGKLGH